MSTGGRHPRESGDPVSLAATTLGSRRSLPSTPIGGGNDAIFELTLNRMRWRARRGLLENDLLLNRFLDRNAYDLDQRQTAALEALLALSDNDLLDLLLARSEPTGDLNTDDVRSLLTLLRAA